jgi:alpha-N-acetylglucosamine transferase
MSSGKSCTDNAIVFVCLHDSNQNADLLELAIISLRGKAGYKDDIIVFTDFDRKLRNQEGMRITRVLVEMGVTKDPKNFRICMNQFYDFGQHRKIIYLDFDILVLRNVNRVFSYIRGDEIYFTYAPVYSWTDSAFMAGGYIRQYRDSEIVMGSPTGICSGIFGIRTKALDKLLASWQQMLQATPTDNDQHALNELIVKGMVKGVALPNEWVSYPYQVRQDADDRRVFNKPRDYIFYHFNPVSNQVKFRMMSEYLEGGDEKQNNEA